jgi:quercetin dioxygenase-like cupin family protein
MQIYRNDAATVQGPDQWFTGAVFVDALTSPTEEQHVNASNVHFAPGARTAWHAHPHGQTIWVTQGIGLVQRRGGPVEAVHPGDRVFFEPGEDHWHGAAPDRLMTHLSMVKVQPGEDAATWGDHVTDDEYGERRLSPRASTTSST